MSDSSITIRHKLHAHERALEGYADDRTDVFKLEDYQKALDKMGR